MEFETFCMNWLSAEQVRRNASACDRWTAFAGHRTQIAARLLSSAPTGKLCVLGAGNCNDLDLPALGRAFAELHLVDIDAAALARGVARQGAAAAGAVRLHGGVDITGCWESWADWACRRPPTEAEFAAALARALSAPPPELGGPFDVAASTCLASQLIEGVVLALGERHPRLMELILAVRTAHVRLLSRLLSPGGVGWLFVDFVSSQTLPELLAAAEPDWRELAPRLASQGNFFHGLNPFALLQLFQCDPLLGENTAGAEIAGFWRWNQTPKTYAVCAIKFRRRP